MQERQTCSEAALSDDTLTLFAKDHVSRARVLLVVGGAGVPPRLFAPLLDAVADRWPLLFVQGEHDTYSVTSEVERYAADVEAPSTRVALLPGGGHSAFMLGTALREILERELPR